MARESPATSDPLIGANLEGRFQVEALVGRGGMAAVYRVCESPTGRVLAAKILPEDHAAGSEFARRFEREAHAMAGLDHPHVIRVHAVGRHQDRPYYVMDYLPHPDLEKLLQGGKAMGWRAALGLAVGIGRALEYVHAKGLVHRDLKPSNVVVVPGTGPVLMDFGLVRDIERTQITATGAVVGTPLYMSPEMMRGSMVEASSDLYQLGLLLYEALSGTQAQRGATMLEVAEKCMSGAIAPVDELVPGLPPGMGTLVANLLGVEPALRYPSAAAFLHDAGEVLQGASIQALADGSTTARLPPRATPSGGLGRPPTTGPQAPAAGPGAPGSLSGPRPLGASGPRPGLRSGARPPLGASRPSGAIAVPVVPELPPAGPGLPVGRAAAAAGLALALLFAWSALRPRDYRPEDFLASAGLTGFEATWSTADACTTQLEVRRPGEDWRLVRPEVGAADAACQHRVRAAGFREGERLQVRVVGPAGRGAETEVVLKRFELRDLAVGRSGRGAEITFWTQGKAHCRLGTTDRKGARRDLPAESETGLRHRLVLDPMSGDLVELELAAELESGELVRLDLAARLAEMADKLAAAAEGFDLEGVVKTRLADPLGARPAASPAGGERSPDVGTRRAAVEKPLLAWLPSLPEYRAVQSLHAMMPWVLASPAVALPVQCRVYGAADRFFQLAWFASDHELLRLAEDIPKDWGDFQEALEPTIPAPLHTYPVPVPAGLDFGNVSIEGKATHSQDFTVDLPEAPDPGGSAELMIKVDRVLRDDLGLRIDLNEAGRFSVYGTRTRLREGKVFYHRFPAALLVRGVNRLHLEPLCMPTILSVRLVPLLELEVRVGK